MNTKLALSALVAALMLTACAKQESASTDKAATPPAPAAPAASDSSATPPASGTAAGPEAGAQAAPPAGAAAESQPAASAAAPATPPATPPKEEVAQASGPSTARTARAATSRHRPGGRAADPEPLRRTLGDQRVSAQRQRRELLAPRGRRLHAGQLPRASRQR